MQRMNQLDLSLPEKILTRAKYDEAVRAYLESWRKR
jgi:hypothetical protein